jgi:CarD family transcriptional regulator
MASRKKAKKTSGRGAKSQQRPEKTAVVSKTVKASKNSAKLERAVRAETIKSKNKAAAKSASPATVKAKTKVAAKRAASPSKSAAPVAPKKKAEAVARSATELQSSPASAAVHIEAKEDKELNRANVKVETAKVEIKNPVKSAAKSAAATDAARTPVAPPSPEATRKAPAASPIVPLQGAAKPVRPGEKAQAGVTGVEPALQKPAAKNPAPRHGFKAEEFVVYPAHGVGQIVAIEEQEVAGFRLELFVITFVKDKMTLRVPVGKAPSVGMRKLSEPDLVKKSLDTLTGRARIKRTMWSRRAQEYEAKINSGDLIAIAEVVRDLYRSDAQPEQSYSERQLYEAALDRMAREVAVVQKLGESEALKAIEGQLQKGQRRGKTETSPDAAGDADVEEAA